MNTKKKLVRLGKTQFSICTHLKDSTRLRVDFFDIPKCTVGFFHHLVSIFGFFFVLKKTLKRILNIFQSQLLIWLVVSTPLKNISQIVHSRPSAASRSAMCHPQWTHGQNMSQIGNLPQIGLKIKKYLKPPPSYYSCAFSSNKPIGCWFPFANHRFPRIHPWGFPPKGRNIRRWQFLKGCWFTKIICNATCWGPRNNTASYRVWRIFAAHVWTEIISLSSLGREGVPTKIYERKTRIRMEEKSITPGTKIKSITPDTSLELLLMVRKSQTSTVWMVLKPC